MNRLQSAEEGEGRMEEGGDWREEGGGRREERRGERDEEGVRGSGRLRDGGMGLR